MDNNKVKNGLEKHPTQCDRLVNYIEKHGSVSTMQAIIELGIVNPSARVRELRAAGLNIITTITESRNRFNEPVRYAVYTIKQGGVC